MRNLTIYDFTDEKSREQIWDEYHAKLEPYRKGISVGCYLCPVKDLCKGHITGNRQHLERNEDKLFEVIEYFLEDFDRLYRKWKLDHLHRLIKRTRRELWKMYNGYEKVTLNDDIAWSKHWLSSLEQIEQDKRWNWTLEEDRTDYRKWKKENYGSVFANLEVYNND